VLDCHVLGERCFETELEEANDGKIRLCVLVDAAAPHLRLADLCGVESLHTPEVPRLSHDSFRTAGTPSLLDGARIVSKAGEMFFLDVTFVSWLRSSRICQWVVIEGEMADALLHAANGTIKSMPKNAVFFHFEPLASCEELAKQ